jgi:hypothetical protein
MVIKDVDNESTHRPGPGTGPHSQSELDHGVTTRPAPDVREARS